MHLRNNCSLCVASFFARTTVVNLHLNDENIDSTMLRWWYVSSNSSGFFSCHLSISALGLNPFTTWFLQVQKHVMQVGCTQKLHGDLQYWHETCDLYSQESR